MSLDLPLRPEAYHPEHTDFDQTDAARKTIRALTGRPSATKYPISSSHSSGFGRPRSDRRLRRCRAGTHVANFTPLPVADGISSSSAACLPGTPSRPTSRPVSARPSPRCAPPPIPTSPPDASFSLRPIARVATAVPSGPPAACATTRRRTPLISNTQLITDCATWHLQSESLQRSSQNGAPPLGADGFAPPSLLSLFAFPQPSSTMALPTRSTPFCKTLPTVPLERPARIPCRTPPNARSSPNLCSP